MNRDSTPPEAPTAEGCENCRSGQPITCEGFCVHCGREVLPRETEATHSGAPGLDTTLTYAESLAAAWFLLGRGSLALGGVIAAAAAIRRVGVGGAGDIFGAALLAVLLIVFCLVVLAPWLVRAMVRKNFRKFSLVVIRHPS